MVLLEKLLRNIPVIEQGVILIFKETKSRIIGASETVVCLLIYSSIQFNSLNFLSGLDKSRSGSFYCHMF